MTKAAIILLADTETSEGMGRMANALTTVKEFQDAGDDAVLIFDGAGTRWTRSWLTRATSTTDYWRTFAGACGGHASTAPGRTA